MNDQEIENLLRGGVEPGAEVWADFGSGAGALTSMLVQMLGPGAKVFSVDADGAKLEKQKQLLESRGQSEQVEIVEQDFTKPLNLPPLDGLLMANALHFVKDKKTFLQNVRSYLKPDGKLVVVEYDTDSSNAYVPYPLSFETFSELIQQCGFAKPAKFATTKSRYWQYIYSAKTHLAS